MGSGITSIPGVTSFGPQTQLTVDSLYLNDATIQVTVADTDLTLAINGTGTLNLGSKKISNLATPTANSDASTKLYVDDTVRSRNLVLTMDVSDGISNAGIAALLTQIAPPSEYRSGTLARILCSFAVNGTTTLDINSLVSATQTEFNTPTGTAFGISNIAVAPATVAAPGLSVSRTVKTFQTNGTVWTFLS